MDSLQRDFKLELVVLAACETPAALAIPDRQQETAWCLTGRFGASLPCKWPGGPQGPGRFTQELRESDRSHHRRQGGDTQQEGHVSDQGNGQGMHSLAIPTGDPPPESKHASDSRRGPTGTSNVSPHPAAWIGGGVATMGVASLQ